MIVHGQEGAFGLMFWHWRGSALARIWPLLLGIFVIAVVVEWGAAMWDVNKDYSLRMVPFTLIGTALSIFLGFRNNACYDRYWEARKAWGSLVNNSRSLAREVSLFLAPQAGPLRRELVRRQIAFTYALKMHLRGERAWQDLAAWLPEEEVAALALAPNVPQALMMRTGERLQTAWRSGFIDNYHLAALEQRYVANSDVQGICERIRNTPLPTSYTILTHRIVGLYCLLLPFGLHTEVGPLSPIVTVFVSYAFLGLDAIGTEIEDPFGTDLNDLPLNQLCRVIERDLVWATGEDEVPPPILPVGKLLL